MQVAQHDDGALSRWKRSECGHDGEALSRIRVVRGGTLVDKRQRVGQELAAVPAMRSPAVDIRAGEATVSVRGGLVDVRPPFGDPDEYLLDEVLGVLPVAAQCVRGVQEPVAVAAGERLELSTRVHVR